MKVYQLSAYGNYAYFSGRHAIGSQRVFINLGDAERYRDEFRKVVCQGGSLTDLADDEFLSINILTLELV